MNEKNLEDLIFRLDKEKMPQHIAIIMDGNGRWAKEHDLKRVQGHREGVTALHNIVEVCGDIDLEYLTVYAFSTENWGRSKTEVSYLLKLIMDSLVKEIDELNENNVNIRFIGTKEKLDESYNKKVMATCRKSWNNTGLHLNIAMNYGGRKELADAFRNISKDIKEEKIPDEITEELINNYLYTAGMPDVDLVIRTSGEERLSNFLLWQTAYAELWFTNTFWPDFSKQEFLEAIIDFQKRKRRFGKR
ncbi:MAG: isoprenyl transferase [Candidatus Cloacimonetes bacterium]|nr:isoprenyl transferase [Candidatus Cloacimonadota bacterium]MCF7814470.1 isoprenyl transferase [Candidatus Cloacimonadota bacterium]MCF7869045.1 isoprenyl transferase [Candidatus Cloacimonadota bacterium]MCF7884440.1 isoprenyl transferase [Candidatus Cloacimonadota bacterium]